jgi:hypothetical protein
MYYSIMSEANEEITDCNFAKRSGRPLSVQKIVAGVVARSSYFRGRERRKCQPVWKTQPTAKLLFFDLCGVRVALESSGNTASTTGKRRIEKSSSGKCIVFK